MKNWQLRCPEKQTKLMTEINAFRNWVWIIGAGIMQVPLIQEAKRRGYYVVVSDGNPKAPGTLSADFTLVLDTYDVEGHLNTAEALTSAPKAVLTVGADVGPTVSAVAEVFGLPAVPFDIADRVRNKLRMREATKHLQDHPVFLEMFHDEIYPHNLWTNKCRLAGIDPYPCVVKPLYRSGSKGISLVKNAWGWPDAMKRARYKKEDRMVIVEEYINGNHEIALDFFVENGKLWLASHVERIFDDERFGIELGHFTVKDTSQTIRARAREFAEALGVDWGPFKIDMKSSRYGWIVLEAATRLSGGFDHMVLAPKARGVDVTGAMLDIALGESLPRAKLQDSKDGWGCVYAPPIKPGVVKKWVLPDQQNGVEFAITHNRVEDLIDCTRRPVYAIVVEDSQEKAIRKAKKLAGQIEVEYE